MMKRYLYIFTFCVAVLIGVALAVGSDIGQGFIGSGVALAASAYATIEQAGSALTQRVTLNFSGAGVTCTDDSPNSRTNCAIPGFYSTVQNNGTPLPQEPTLNLTTNLTCADEPGNSRTNCSASGGASGGFIQPLTAPVAANFSQVNFNAGTGVTSTQTNATSPVTFITIRQQDPTFTGNAAAIAKAKLAATFTVTVGVTLAGDVKAGIIAGLFLSDGTGMIIFGVDQTANNDGAYHPFILTNNSFIVRSGSNVFAPAGNGGLYGPILWLRVQETVSARNYYMSSDGLTFYLVFTESNTANLTTSEYGFGLGYFNGTGQTYDGGITDYSFTETNP